MRKKVAKKLSGQGTDKKIKQPTIMGLSHLSASPACFVYKKPGWGCMSGIKIPQFLSLSFFLFFSPNPLPVWKSSWPAIVPDILQFGQEASKQARELFCFYFTTTSQQLFWAMDFITTTLFHHPRQGGWLFPSCITILHRACYVTAALCFY